MEVSYPNGSVPCEQCGLLQERQTPSQECPTQDTPIRHSSNIENHKSKEWQNGANNPSTCNQQSTLPHQ
eukprot:6808441-Ditylum_brightwellii.AAC.2